MFSLFKKIEKDAIHIDQIDTLLEKGIKLIDIREPYEYKNTSIKGAKNIPMGELLDNTSKYLKKDGKYYLMCQSGNRSGRMVTALKRLGFDVVNVAGGISAYKGKNRR